MVDYEKVIREIWQDLQIVHEPDRLELARKLETRTKNFAISIIRLSTDLPKTEEGRVIKNQLTKSGTSIGANYREANRSRSKADFKSRIKICESEASETNYWLEIIYELKLIKLGGNDTLLNECRELLAIFTSISRSLR
jgi:four helix bundle protein